MKKFGIILSATALIAALTSCNKMQKQQKLNSPNNQIETVFSLTKTGEPAYSVVFNGQPIIKPSLMGFSFENQPPLSQGLELIKVERTWINQKWELPWGETREVIDKHNSMTLYLKETGGQKRLLNIVFKAFDNGIAFRYVFPGQPAFSQLQITDENTEFNLTGNHLTFWQPGDWDIYEHLYNTTQFSGIDATKYRNHKALAQTHIPFNAVNTPVTLITSNGVHISIHEAALTGYSSMTLLADTVNYSFKSCLVGTENRVSKVIQNTPFATPWRTISITKNAAQLIESTMILNLNEPNKLGDVSWIKPTKYVGIWWDMHLDTRTWDYGSTQDMSSQFGAKPHGKHGATTQYAKQLIDFAAQHNIGGILVEGWNTGWEHWIGFEDREGVFDFVTPYPDYNLKQVVDYGKSKGVELIMHHETSAATQTYTKQLDTAFTLMKSLGIGAVKTGYVGKILPKGEYHQGQYMVEHYHNVIETAAKYQIAVNAHEGIKATGKRRTYPNEIARETFRGQEFNAWSPDGGNPPEHLTILAFTTNLAGPMDYTPGIFNIKLKPHKPNNQVNTTLAHQLALYVVIYSPIQMVPDLIENYKNNPAFKFIEDVPVNWQKTLALNGAVGDYVTIARQDRETDNWFIGSITDENPRELNIELNFLDQNQNYTATIYADAPDAHWDNNPTAFVIDTLQVNNKSVLNLKLAAGGGTAISIIKN